MNRSDCWPLAISIPTRDGKVWFGLVFQPFFENREPDHQSGSEIMMNREPDRWFGPKWSGSGSQGVQTRTGPFFISFFFFFFVESQ
jgi:hypothetical protein